MKATLNSISQTIMEEEGTVVYFEVTCLAELQCCDVIIVCTLGLPRGLCGSQFCQGRASGERAR